MNNKIEKIIEKATARVWTCGQYAYINFAIKYYKLTPEQADQVRHAVSEYIDQHEKELFKLDFTINGKAC